LLCTTLYNVHGRKMTPNSTEVRPNSTTLPSRTLWPNTLAKLNFGPPLIY